MEIISNTTRATDLTFFRNGRIDISAYVTRTLGIEDGDMIAFATEDDEYYIFVYKRKDSIIGRCNSVVRRTRRSANCKTMRMYDVAVCRRFLEMCGGGDVVYMRVGSCVDNEQYGKCLNIITHGYRD